MRYVFIENNITLVSSQLKRFVMVSSLSAGCSTAEAKDRGKAKLDENRTRNEYPAKKVL